MSIKNLLTWLCVIGLNLFVMCGNCAEKSLSPFQILAAIERPDGTIDHLQLWSQFGIKSRLFKEEYPKLDIFTLNSGANHWKLLRLSDRWPGECQYLLFRLITKDSWHFCGNIDFADVYYEMPEHQLQEIANRKWLMFEHVGGHGTGIYFRETTWYPLNDSFGVCELHYLHSGHSVDITDKNKKLDEYSLINQECTVTNGKPMVELLHSVTGSATDEAGNKHILYKKDVHTRFVWSEKTMKFEVSEPIDDTLIVR